LRSRARVPNALAELDQPRAPEARPLGQIGGREERFLSGVMQMLSGQPPLPVIIWQAAM